MTARRNSLIKKEEATFVVVRSYSGQGAQELFDLLGQRQEDVKDLIGGVPGFASYAAFGVAMAASP